MKIKIFRSASGTFWAELITTVYFCFFLHFNWIRIADVWDIYDTPLIVLAVLYLAKIWLMAWLEGQGGEPWDYGRSRKLVISGPYQFTRNPVYTLVLVQLVVWMVTVIAAMAQADVWHDQDAHSIAWMIGSALCLAWFYFYADRFAIPREETNLAADHTAAFAAYCRRVGRWGLRPRAHSDFAAVWDAAE